MEVRRSSEMIGLGVELARLLKCAERARVGEVTLAVITGEAGIGKSRLVSEFVA